MYTDTILKETGSSQEGGFPIIQINGYTFSPAEIEYMEISTYGFIPTIYLNVTTKNATFRSKHLPHDGDLISIRIMPSATIYKKISCDFLITDFTTSYSSPADGDGDVFTFSFTGILNITNFYSSTTSSYNQKTSFEVLNETSNNYNMGFVSNVDSTEDKMNWICSNKPPCNFIQDVVMHSYKNTTSFFNTWIDYFYNLNLLEMNKMLSVADDYQSPDGIYTGALNLARENVTEDKFEKEPIMLTNNTSARSDNKYFNSYSFINNSGMVSSLYGYKRKLNFYDNVLKEAQSFDMMASLTQGAEFEKIIMLGRPGENYWKTQFKSRWNGIQYTENVHPNYFIAKNQNFINLQYNTKMQIELNLPKLNSLVYKGMVCPVMFWSESDNPSSASGNFEDGHPRNNPGNIDRTLAGNYFVNGVKIIWYKNMEKDESDEKGGYKEKPQWSQKLRISRREFSFSDAPKNWPSPEE